MADHNRAAWRPMEIPADLAPQGIYIGTSGYYYDDWIGIFNPPRRRATRKAPGPSLFPASINGSEEGDRDRLLFYQKYFSFVEINHTFYQEPARAYFEGIERRSRQGMKYAVKVHKELSHTRAWDAPAAEAARDIIRAYAGAVAPIVESGHFFSFLIQLEDRCYRTQERLDYLRFAATEALRLRLDVHVEFRHASWHAGHVLQSLKDAGIGVCNTDIPPIPHVFPLKAYATTDKGYLRYSGRNLEHWYPARAASSAGRIAARNARYNYEYSDRELDGLVAGQATLMRKTGQMAVAFNNHFQAQAIRNALENIKRLGSLLAVPRDDRSQAV